jgi:large subunit ribosomal protein L4
MNGIRNFDATGKELQTVPLGVETTKELSPRTYACAIRVLLQNWRQGTVGCKTRSDLAFSNKKPWRQKGTGRARAGSLRSPLWRKGAVLFGPQPRERELKINKNQRQVCFQNLLDVMMDKKAVYCLDHDFGTGKTPQTKKAYELLKNMKIEGKKGVLFLTHDDAINYSSFRNIPSVSVLYFDQPNAFDLSGTEYWIFLKKDFELFKGMVEKWI